jgi:hypothetical protein
MQPNLQPPRNQRHPLFLPPGKAQPGDTLGTMAGGLACAGTVTVKSCLVYISPSVGTKPGGGRLDS